jgi:hypothetical protein
LDLGFGQNRIYFDYFVFQTKETKRHKWKTQASWSRLMRRDSTIDKPVVPEKIETMARTMFKEKIDELSIE